MQKYSDQMIYFIMEIATAKQTLLFTEHMVLYDLKDSWEKDTWKVTTKKMIDTFLEQYNNSSPKFRDEYDAIITAIDKWCKDKDFRFDVYTKKQ